MTKTPFGDERGREVFMGKIIKTLKNSAGFVIACVLTVALLKCVRFIGYVPSASMEPAIRAESYIIGFRLYGSLEIGDIIVFKRNGRMLVKRVAGLPGDVLYIDDATNSVMREADASHTRALTVPEHSYFVLGDNAAESFDSRYWSDPFVRAESVVAKL
jgi:signal peptidase I